MAQKRNLEFMQIVGALLIIIALFLVSVVYQGAMYSKFKKNGILTKAKVVKKYTKETRTVLTDYTSASGTKQKYRNDFLIDITFFTKSQTGSGIKFIKANLQIDESNLKKLKKGDEIEITYLSEDPENTAIIKEIAKTGLKKEILKKYQEYGINVNATITDIDSEKKSVYVMFMTKLNASTENYISSTLDVSKSVWDSVNEGENIEIFYLPENPKEVVSKAMLEKGMINPYLISVLAMASFGIGIFLILKYRH